MARIKLCLVLALLSVATLLANSQTSAGASDPAKILERAREVMGFDKLHGAVIHTSWITAMEQPYQSDRTYPPFFSAMITGQSWTDPGRAIERVESSMMFPGGVVSPKLATSISDADYEFALRDHAAPVPQARDDSRDLDPWLVLAEWSLARDVKYAGREVYRDYPRDVLARTTAKGEERLYLDPKTGYPVMLEREEPHYLWGQQRIRYVYSVWQQFGQFFTPTSTFRMADDEVETSRTIGSFEVVAAGASPSMVVPDAPKEAVDPMPIFLRPYPPKVLDVSPNTKLLVNRGYREAIAQVGNEVYVFDATQGEERARQDREIIQKLFPRAKRVNVVVTDLAWPHVAGVRFWVANGATIISHRAAKPFLQSVLDRRWTLHPDSYEKARKTARFKFVAVDGTLKMAGGKVQLHAIDGIGSEVALIAYLPDERFLWASDYIQSLDSPTMYAKDVIEAAARAGFQPQHVAAEHLPLSDWTKVVAAQQVKEQSTAAAAE